MLEMCQRLFDEDFESVLEDSLQVLRGRKEVKREITHLVEKCATNLVAATAGGGRENDERLFL
jgi:hypothetical protein